jgi:CheY-like chemotaxis protein
MMGSKQEVLVLEDDHVTFAVEEFVLGKLGLVGLRVDSLEQALRLAITHLPCLILLDVDSFGSPAAIRELHVLTENCVPIVGTGGPAEQAWALAAGCDAYVARPLVAWDLTRALGTVLVAPASV